MRTVHALVAALVVAVLSAAGCRCGKPAAPAAAVLPPLAVHVPSEVDGALWVPDLAALGSRLRALESLKVASFAAQLQGHASG
ncbi:MAG: hypothetical protein FJ086_00200, partial [Deltaproteobacteria bacterium]|nr:hypothetical protein [Deltaproteobacteria bacterium]